MKKISNWPLDGAILSTTQNLWEDTDVPLHRPEQTDHYFPDLGRFS